MKWGVRRFQNPDGSLTAQGRARLGYGPKKSSSSDAELDRKRAAYLKSHPNTKLPPKSYTKAVKKLSGNKVLSAVGSQQVKEAQAQNSAIRSLKRMAYSKTGKSDLELSVEAKLKKQGMSSKEAEVETKRRMKTIATVAAVAAVSVGVAIAATKYRKYSKDIIVGSAKTPLWRVQLGSDKINKVDNAIFSTFSKRENKNYQGFGQQNRIIQAFLYRARNGGKNPSLYNMKVTYNNGQGVKIASNKHAKALYKDMLKNNSAFRQAVDEMKDVAGNTPFGSKQRLARGYDKFNINLGEGGKDSKAAKMFFSELEKRGYGGIRDINDAKYSHYGTHSVITFGKNVASKAKEISESQGSKMLKRDIARRNGRALAPSAAMWGGAMATYAYGKNKNAQQKAESKVISRRATSMYNSGVPVERIAKQLGISKSQVYAYVNT